MFRLLGFLLSLFLPSAASTQENSLSNPVCEFVLASEYLSKTKSLVEECSNNPDFYRYGVPKAECDQFDMPALCVYYLVDMKLLVVEALRKEMKSSILEKITVSVEQMRKSSDALCRAEQEAYESASMWNMTNSAYIHALCLNRSQDSLLSVFYTAHWASESS